MCGLSLSFHIGPMEEMEIFKVLQFNDNLSKRIKNHNYSNRMACEKSTIKSLKCLMLLLWEMNIFGGLCNRSDWATVSITNNFVWCSSIQLMNNVHCEHEWNENYLCIYYLMYSVCERKFIGFVVDCRLCVFSILSIGIIFFSSILLVCCF